MRQAKAWAMLRQELDQTSVVRQDIYRPSFDLRKNALMEVIDLVGHAAMLANTLTAIKLPATPSSQVHGACSEGRK